MSLKCIPKPTHLVEVTTCIVILSRYGNVVMIIIVMTRKGGNLPIYYECDVAYVHNDDTLAK